MSRRYVNQLTHGDSVDEPFLVADKQLRANRQGNLYLHLELRDKTGAAGARLWNASEGLARTFEPGDFLPQGTQNVAKLTARLRELMLSLTNPHLRALAECFLIDDEFVRKFTTAPAGIKNHHAYHGGLLEHVVNLLTLADRIVDLYPDLDRDLLM